MISFRGSLWTKQQLLNPLSDALESRKALNSDAHSITTLLADVQAEFHRREQDKKALFIKWVEEGTVSESIALFIVQVT